MSEKRSVVRAMAGRYRKAEKKEKGRMLDELVALTGYNRWYAVWLLRSGAKVLRVSPRMRLKADLQPCSGGARGRVYDAAVVQALSKIWMILDCICGKRLVAILGEVIPILQKHGEIALDAGTRDKLMRISAATIDRVLSPKRKAFALRGRSGTRPGTLLKRQIPIRTFAQWNDTVAGFVEIDLVGHDGGDGHGDFCQTLDVTDIASGWTETRAVPNKAQVWVFGALKAIRAQLPFALLGIDSDNGSEFINAQLIRYCQQEKLTFTRGRVGNKNDACFVEQKNYSIVRRAVGYARYNTAHQLRLLNELYSYLRLYTNYFQPVMKLLTKERNGAKVKKTYDHAQTPYARVLSAKTTSDATRRRLRTEYAKLNPAQLKRQISRLQHALFKSAAVRPKTASPAQHLSAQAAPARLQGSHRDSNATSSP